MTRTAPKDAWVQNEKWPGVHVVEGPLVSGSTNIVVAVDPGTRAVLAGSRVPWRLVKQTPEMVARAAVAAVLI